MHYQQLLARYPITSDQMNLGRLAIVLRELSNVLDTVVPGAVVEFGCYSGTTSLFIRRLIGDQRSFHVYDSFAGLPEKSDRDNSSAGTDFQVGALSTSKKRFVSSFQHANLKLPVIHKSWFSELTADDLPKQIAFAFLDGDFYQSIIDSLGLVWPRLSIGGSIVIDDYGRAALPGVERAVQDFFKNQHTHQRITQQTIMVRRLTS
jgi:O-methyltransferase